MKTRKHTCIFDEEIYFALKELGIYYEFYLVSKVSGSVIRKVNMFNVPCSTFHDEYYTFSYKRDGEIKKIRVDTIGNSNNILYNVYIGWGSR